MNDILFLPVKPKWAKLIMSGQKTIELRKRLPSKGFGKRCVIYASSPWCEVVGTAQFVDCGRILRPEAMLENACVTTAEFWSYFGTSAQHCLSLADPHTFMHWISLETLRQRWDIKPPQQWRYIDEKTFREIVEAGQ